MCIGLVLSSCCSQLLFSVVVTELLWLVLIIKLLMINWHICQFYCYSSLYCYKPTAWCFCHVFLHILNTIFSLQIVNHVMEIYTNVLHVLKKNKMIHHHWQTCTHAICVSTTLHTKGQRILVWVAKIMMKIFTSRLVKWLYAKFVYWN